MTLSVPWLGVSRKIAELLGLHFPPEREQDLRRGLDRAAPEAGFSVYEFACHLLADRATRNELDILASHLTVGETYFFRDPDLMDALKQRVLPEMTRLRASTRRLRLWSAGCCTGEEPYTLAMLLCDAIPDLDRWHISILATDINPRFLHSAEAGVFGEWSFRAMPESLRRRHFRKLSNGRHAIDERLRAMVTFAPLNLSDAVYPSVVTATNAMDLILCRNVLMYFEPAQARAVAARLSAALAEDGFLAVAACETSRTLFSGLEPIAFGNAHAYRKAGLEQPPVRSAPSPVPAAVIPLVHPTRAPVVRPRSPPQASVSATRIADAPPPLGVRAKALADQGQLEEALALCDGWIASDALDPAGHYLKALISMETGNLEAAGASLQRCAYLAPEEPMVTFALGNLDRLRGRHRLALNAYRYVLEQLSSRDPADALTYSDGLTAGQLSALVSELVASEQMHERAA